MSMRNIDYWDCILRMIRMGNGSLNRTIAAYQPYVCVIIVDAPIEYEKCTAMEFTFTRLGLISYTHTHERNHNRHTMNFRRQWRCRRMKNEKKKRKDEKMNQKISYLCVSIVGRPANQCSLSRTFTQFCFSLFGSLCRMSLSLSPSIKCQSECRN